MKSWMEHPHVKAWMETPSVNYHLKSSFSWPGTGTGAGVPPNAFPSAALPGAAAEAAGAAASAGTGFAGHGGAGGYPPRGGWHPAYGYGRGYGWHGRRRFGFGRRVFWFGLGVGAASWYIHAKEKHQEAERYIANQQIRPSGTSNGSDTDSRAQGYPNWSSWHHDRHGPVNTAQPPPPLPFQDLHPGSIPDSQILAQLRPTAPAAEPTSTASETEDHTHRRRWGWGARRAERQRQEQEAAAARNASATTNTPTAQAEDWFNAAEVQRFRDAAEGLWAERRKAAMEIQEKANEKARHYAREKLDVLTKAVENFRDSLNAEEIKRTREAERKMV